MKRLFKTGFTTTAIGMGIIVFTGLMIWTSRASAGDMSGWITLGLMFLRSKDSLIGIQKQD